MKALVVAAHPDDHLLWCGGTIIKFPDWEWHIISLCNSHNKDFSTKETTFIESCRELKARRFEAKQLHDHSKLEEVSPPQIENSRAEILKFADKNYDLVFTHSNSPTCEYSFHANHYETREAVNKILNGQEIKTDALMFFCYKSGGINQPVIADTDEGNYKIVLSQEEIIKKQKIKHLFTWATDDLKGLCLWDSQEPVVEAFKTRIFNPIELPTDFI